MNIIGSDSSLVRKEVSRRVDFSEKGANIRQVKAGMDKDDFLKILVTQLTHQDPMAPMQDREFVAQMAQFSSLEQMTNMNRSISSLANQLSSSRAIEIFGKIVEISVGDSSIKGKVEQVTLGEFPQVRVKGVYYDYADVKSIELEEKAI